MQCKHYTIEKKRCKLHTTENNIFCHRHIKTTTNFTKPKECPICWNSIHQCSKPLICGHWVHKTCIIKSNKAECPICRQQLYNFYEKVKIPEYTSLLAVITYQLYSYIIHTENRILGLDHFINCILTNYVSNNHPLYNFYLSIIYGNALNIFLNPDFW